MGKEQALGEAANLGCPRAEAPGALTTAVSGGPNEFAGPAAAAIPAAVRGGPAAAAIPAAIRGGPATAVTASTSGGAGKASTSTRKT